MKIIKSFVAIAVIVLFSTCKKEAVTPTSSCNFSHLRFNNNHSKAQRFQALMQEYIKKGLPGIVLLIEDQDGLWVGSAGKADLEESIDMQPCHLNKTASLTKPFMAALAFKLEEEGVLSVDEPISKYLPSSLISRITNGDRITTRMLLAHQSGIFDLTTDSDFYLSVLNNPNKQWEPEELLKFVYDKEPVFAPGSSAGYSNTNTLLVSLVIDHATGRNHGELLKEKILSPLDLNSTYYHWRQELPEHEVAQGYFDLYNNGTLINVSNLNTGNGNGYNGIYSTVADLYIFARKLLIEKTLVSERSLESMLTFHPQEETGKFLGQGLFKDFINRAPNEYAYGHRGRDLACSGEMFYFPEKERTFVLLVNYGNDAESALKPVYFEFKDRVVDVLME